MSRDLNVKHLEYFLKVAQLGSINKAAQALFISQPYLGKIIHDLEDGFGYLLLNRGNHGVTLTPEGESSSNGPTMSWRKSAVCGTPQSGRRITGTSRSP